MRRREFIGGLAGAAAWPLAAKAQQTNVRRIGIFIGLADDAEGQARVHAIRDGLKLLGWMEGQNIQLYIRFSRGDPAIMEVHAKQLVSLLPDVIVVSTNLALAALRAETK